MNTRQSKKYKTGMGWICAIAVVCVSVPPPAFPATWTGGGPDANWSTAANWDTGPTPGDPATEALIFEGTAKQSNNNDLGPGYFTDVTFQGGGFTINGATKLGISGNLTTAGDNAINTGLTLGGDGIRFINGPVRGNLTIDKGVDFHGLVLQDNTTGMTILNGPFTGGGELRIFSLGQMVLGGDNSDYDGVIKVFRFVKLSNEKALGGASTTVILDGSFEPAYVDLNGLNVSGVNVSFHVAKATDATARARLRNTGAKAAAFCGNINLDAAGGVDGGGDMTLSGTIGGEGGDFVKEGVGTLRLTGANTFGTPRKSHGGTAANTFSTGLEVKEGPLLANNRAGSASGNAPVRVAAGAAFGGTGSIATDLVLDRGLIAPGDKGIGALTVGGDTTWNAGEDCPWRFELGTGGAADKLVVKGSFIKGTGKKFLFDFQKTGAPGTYPLVTFQRNRGFSASDFSCTNLPAGRTGTFFLTASQLSFVLK